MLLDSRKVESALLSKGFIEDNTHHKYLVYYLNGLKTPYYTYVSHSGNGINDYLIGQMSKQLQLTKKDTIDLFNCPLSKEGLFKIYEEKQKAKK